MPKVCQDMHKCHNYHAILHKLYMWFGKNELRLYLNKAKKFHRGPRRPPPLKIRPCHVLASHWCRADIGHVDSIQDDAIMTKKLLEIDLSANHTINHYFIVRPHVVQRAGQLSLSHVAISKTEKNRNKHKTDEQLI